MKKTRLSWILAVVIMAMFLASCRKLELTTGNGLFLKPASAGEIAVVNYLKDGKINQFSYPNNLLFEVKKEEAKVLNSMLVVKDFDLLSNNEAMFLVAEYNSKPIVLGTTADGKTLYDMSAQNVYATKLPFTISDYGLQTNDANGRFNGLIKAENYVIALNSGKILIYDLRTGTQISTTGSIQSDVLTFKVGSVNWVLKFTANSPVGNIFKLTVGAENFSCYTISSPSFLRERKQ